MPFVSLSSNDVAFDLVALIEKITDADRAAEFKEQAQIAAEEINKLRANAASLKAGLLEADKHQTPVLQKELDGVEKTLQELEIKRLSPLAKLVAEKKYTELFEVGVFGKMDVLLSSASAQEVDSCFSLCFTLLACIEPEQVGDMISRLARSLSQDATHAQIRLRLLGILFNLLETLSPLRAPILLQMLRLATSSNQSSVLVGEFSRIEQWMDQWDITVEERAEMLLLMSKAYSQTNQTFQGQVYLLKYLKTFEGADSARLADSAEYAYSAALFAIAEANVHQVDPLLELSAVKNLDRKDAAQKEKDVYRLLSIFALQGLTEFNEFVAERKGVIADLGLDEAECLAKIRRLSILSLCANVDTLQYRDVQKALQLSDEQVDEVEEAIIDAVAYSCLDAKLDQENSLVLVRRVDQRAFTGSTASWTGLNQQLGRWLESVDSIIDGLQHLGPAQQDDDEY
jgi:translation initiation factor 3 subunit M